MSNSTTGLCSNAPTFRTNPAISVIKISPVWEQWLASRYKDCNSKGLCSSRSSGTCAEGNLLSPVHARAFISLWPLDNTSIHWRKADTKQLVNLPKIRGFYARSHCRSNSFWPGTLAWASKVARGEETAGGKIKGDSGRQWATVGASLRWVGGIIGMSCDVHLHGLPRLRKRNGRAFHKRQAGAILLCKKNKNKTQDAQDRLREE